MNMMNFGGGGFGGGGFSLMPMQSFRPMDMNGMSMGQSRQLNPYSGQPHAQAGMNHLSYRMHPSEGMSMRNGSSEHDSFHQSNGSRSERSGRRGGQMKHVNVNAQHQGANIDVNHGWHKVSSSGQDTQNQAQHVQDHSNASHPRSRMHQANHDNQQMQTNNDQYQQKQHSGMQQVNYNNQQTQTNSHQYQDQNGSPTYGQRMQDLNQHFSSFLGKAYPGLSIPEAAQSFNQTFYQPFQQRVGQYVGQFNNAVLQFPTNIGTGFGNLTNAVYGALGVPSTQTIPGFAAPYQYGSQPYGLSGGSGQLGFGGQSLGYNSNPFGGYTNPYQNGIIPPAVSGNIYPASSSFQGVPQIPNIGQLM